MRDLYQIVVALFMFMLCINGGFWFIGNALGIPGIAVYSTDFETLNQTYGNQANEFEDDGGFNPALIFGDFGRGITVFMELISGKYVLATMTNFGLSESFILPIQVIVGFMTVVSLVYLVSGRQ